MELDWDDYEKKKIDYVDSLNWENFDLEISFNEVKLKDTEGVKVNEKKIKSRRRRNSTN